MFCCTVTLFECSLARAEELEGSLERLKGVVAQAEARKASEDAALEEVFALRLQWWFYIKNK